MADEIGRIVAYVKELDAVDTTGVEATAHVGGIVPKRSEESWRADTPQPGLSHEDALGGAPETGHGGFVVPTFVGS
jgi:aspartyl/glutamyl-tRNA(Asn/Gln) amidotransferase C subunit